MDNKQVEAFRQQLLDLQKDLAALKTTAAAASGVVELDQTSVGRLSRMDAPAGPGNVKGTGASQGA